MPFFILASALLLAQASPQADARCAALFKGHFDGLPAAWGGEKIRTLSVLSYYSGKLAASTGSAQARALVARATAELAKVPPAQKKLLADTCSGEMGSFGEASGL